MQKELENENPNTKIRLMSCNAWGTETGLVDLCDGGDLPVVQDTVAAHVWDDWQVQWRDVAILDEDNIWVATYNLTTYDLKTPANYQTLKDMLKTAAGE
ncbi:MAG: hypothetical protein ACYSX0_12930 [Planctomycetota bacterium]|jgi:hypothetical protein